MPKSHFPARGGPQSVHWNPARPVTSEAQDVLPDDTRPPKKAAFKALEAENLRLRQELERVRKNDMPNVPSPGMNSHRMVWTAYALCGAALLFALVALWSR